jgi:hypothetical protein
MIGNAVPVELARFVATALFQHAAKVADGLHAVAPPELVAPPEIDAAPAVTNEPAETEAVPDVVVALPEVVVAPEPEPLPATVEPELLIQPDAPPEAIVPPVLDRKTAAVWSHVIDLADLMQVSGRERDAMLAKCAEAFNEAFEEMSPRRAA